MVRHEAASQLYSTPRGDAAGFRADEAVVVANLQEGSRTATPPYVATARQARGDTLTRL